MKAKAISAAVLAVVLTGLAASSPAKLYSDLERHLQSLKSLELTYEVAGVNAAGSTVSGRLVWVKPDRFYHDTPEWAMAEIGRERWRFLKVQNTLIRELVTSAERWSPESVLFDLTKNFRAVGQDDLDDGTRLLRLESKHEDMPGSVTLDFASHARVPNRIRFESADGTLTDYRITSWRENGPHDESLFIPPTVPAENLIDFRSAAEGGQ